MNTHLLIANTFAVFFLSFSTQGTVNPVALEQ
jgi:hypothetical protein